MALPPPRTLRTKRNFKALQLPTGPTLNLAPVNTPPRKPPPPLVAGNSASSTVGTAAATSNTHPTATTSNTTAATATTTTTTTSSPSHPPKPSTPIPSSGDTPVTPQQRSAIRATITKTIAGFPRKSLDLQNEKLVHIREIGQGNGGSVSLVRHRDTDIIMAKKIVLIDAKPSVRKQIVRELQIMHECNSTYIIECYGSYLADPNICICMEYMDRGSFDRIYKKIGPIHIDVVARVAMSVLEGLTYLYDVHRIIHRDIKPSNILCNTKGEIKLCDFGVSGELINSIANTFVGTSIYMSPERIQGAEYSVKSDIWSLGITLVELATGRFPFSDEEGYSADQGHHYHHHHGQGGGGGYSAYGGDSRLPDLDEESVMILTAAATHLNLDSPMATTTTATAAGNSTTTTITRAPVHHHYHRDALTNTTLRSPPPPLSSNSGTTQQQPPPPPPPLHNKQRHTRRKSNGVSLHGSGMTMSIIELMHHIVREPAPRLPEGRFVKWADEFVDACLEKEVEMRKTPGVLLNYQWVQDAKESRFDLAKWAAGLEV